MTILFRCDGSPEIGMGHVVRCFSLAIHIKKKYNCKILFAIKRSDIVQKYIKGTFPIFIKEDSSLNNIEWLLECSNKIGASAIIFDIRNDLSHQDMIDFRKSFDGKIVCIDDPEEKSKEADIVFLPPVPQTQYLNEKDYKGKLFIGWEYVIINEKFKKNKEKFKNEILRIVLTQGGSDNKNHTHKIVKILNDIKLNFQLDIILGPGYTELNTWKKSLNTFTKKYHIYSNPKNFHEIISRADIGIISFGQTAYEFAAVKVPALYVCVTADHATSAKVFEKFKLGKIIGQVPIDMKNTKILIGNSLTDNVKKWSLNIFFKSLEISNLNLISKSILKEIIK